jgi:Tol biopolymer transport system component
VPLSTLVWIDRSGSEEPLELGARRYGNVRISPDGMRIAAGIEEAGRRDIWVSDPARRAWTRLLRSQDSTAWGNWLSNWTPDSRRVVYQSDLGRLAWALADGTGETEPLLAIQGMVILVSSGWTPDGKELLIGYGTPAQIRIGLLPMVLERDTGRRSRPFIDRDGKASGAQVSPAGGWVAYQSFDSGKYEIYIERFPGLGGRQAVSGAAGGFNPMWSRDGEKLFYRRLTDGAMMAVRLQSSPFVVGVPEMLFADPGAFQMRPPRAGGGAGLAWDIAPDGRFLMIRSSEDQPADRFADIVLVQNWTEELRRLDPTR